ncbi:hypothetical protein LTR99_000998 [Exophiala xenobiotica]|uniref:GAR domain-containing protein n=1 Tax=Vermiconidia calcicola TaxID=1690605 RepID=A0AAV9QMS9_9PEZI|nr:hypothetical protein LTR96_003670 [Exophiala xenobiotica]KAK5534869.1 hypothetical protein LTR23_008665 [Chaetothyriales sp. CCFEE 6169]KAK5545561.1 hypothetical protein LTR25_000568 [Vermiconidia calcicola]KAK5308026.1 hypothetical protein LTR99_000998 [Exophiala xenobiotica]KAK5343076.1 hypothetical protein LTR98_000705 [Exophiala xenobiotica]
MALTTPTRPNFPHFDLPFDSRSPSRSPRRKAQFAVRELDPLLGNLSPDSTLRALQATDTIPGGASQDALASSIGDATPAEREVGIRAAFAAQKLRAWKDELSKWTWPGKRERSYGLGFITPQGANGMGSDYRGSLTVTLAEEYEARLEEIRDDLDSLRIEDIKDHVLEAHVPARASPQTPQTGGIRTSYGRMRDFTALVTATVIQALPDLAKLNILLDTWDIRLRVLRQLPRFLQVMDSTQSDIQAAINEAKDAELGDTLTENGFESRKLALGSQVADLGRRVDRLLDMLEGQEDSLPQAWIDRIEMIELDYATWVVDAQHVVLKNNLAVTANRSVEPETRSSNPATTSQDKTAVAPGSEPHDVSAKTQSPPQEHFHQFNAESPSPGKGEKLAKRKPSLKLTLPERKGHRRDISKVSVADSTISTFSDISNAEIMDARTASVLPSPKVSLVDNPFRASRDELTWFGNPSAAQHQMTSKPPMLQRASTACVEVVPKDQVKRLNLTRSASWDMLSRMPESPESTPSKALRQLTGADSPVRRTPIAELEASEVLLGPPTAATDDNPLATPSLEVEPLRVKTREEDLNPSAMPALPRRSSKRNSANALGTFSPLTPVSSASPLTPIDGSRVLPQPSSATSVKDGSPKSSRKAESLEDRIQDILTSLPTKIRLAKDSDSSRSPQPSSTTSTRSSTPTPALTLSPVTAETSAPKSEDSGVRIYHLTRAGQARDAPPVKLFVRTVGDSQRVMVRVGGGWADLGEYLREYSLHHGSRATGDGRLEVASFPTNNPKDSTVAHSATGPSASQSRRKSRSPTANQLGFEINSSPDLVNSRLRPSTRVISPEPEKKILKNKEPWTPPPVPPIPAPYTTKSPTITTSTSPDVGAVTSVVDPDRRAARTPNGTRTSANPRSTTISVPGVTTITTVTPPTATTNYTPLGGAGPKTYPRRAVTFGTTSTPNNDAWVENMVGKARAVSGGNPTVLQGPTTTTTTTTVTSSTPTSRRASSFMSLSPNSSPSTVSPSPSNASAASDVKDRRLSLTGRSKSRMSLSDMSGIRRVFLRKKSENVR